MAEAINDNGSKKMRTDAYCDAWLRCSCDVEKMDSHQKRIIIYTMNFRFGCCHELCKHPRFPAMVMVELVSCAKYTTHIHKILSVIWPLFRFTYTELDATKTGIPIDRNSYSVYDDTMQEAQCTQLQLRLHRPKCPECLLGLLTCKQSIFHMCFTNTPESGYYSKRHCHIDCIYARINCTHAIIPSSRNFPHSRKLYGLIKS